MSKEVLKAIAKSRLILRVIDERQEVRHGTEANPIRDEPLCINR